MVSSNNNMYYKAMPNSALLPLFIEWYWWFSVSNLDRSWEEQLLYSDLLQQKNLLSFVHWYSETSVSVPQSQHY